MIVSCPSCDSKYQIADEKVAGNVLRTRCKACGSQILVDGTIPPGPKSEEGEDDVTRIMRPEDRLDIGESKPPASGNRWTVHIGDAGTRPMTTSEIVQALVKGDLDDDVPVWKTGMANWASIADIPELMAAIQQTGRSVRRTATGPSGISKPPPPSRAGTVGTATDASSRVAPTAHNSAPSRTSKPPPPARAAVAGSSAKSSPAKAIPVENAADALDPAASTSDFYSKLLSKVGASKSKSSPPAATAESRLVNRPRATMPPPRDTSSALASRNSPARISSIKKEPAAAESVPSNLDPAAAPSDFYAKILAKVRPQQQNSVPPVSAETKPSGAGRATLPPPTWGAIAAQPENYARAHPPSRVPAPVQSVTASPIRVLGSSPASARAAEVIDIPVDVEAGMAGTSEIQTERQNVSQSTAPVAFRRASPSPPKRPDPVIPVDIQLPPMEGNAEARFPGSPSVVVSASTRPPAPEAKVEAKPLSDVVGKP